MNPEEMSLFELERELVLLFERMEEIAEAEDESKADAYLKEQFEQYLAALGDKVDRVARFLSLMEWRAQYCRREAERLSGRARSSERRIASTEAMVLYFLKSRGLKRIEGVSYTLRLQKNSQDSVLIREEGIIPMEFRDVEVKVPGSLWRSTLESLPEPTAKLIKTCVKQMPPSNAAIKAAAAEQIQVPGASVERGEHLRVA